MNVPYFDIREQRESGVVRLVLTGELDLGSAPVLRARLEELQAEQSDVRLDLSRLEFMDSTGLHLLISVLQDARADSWQLQVDPNLAPAVRSLFQLVNVDPFIFGEDGAEP
jgi:anti-anti-sigma factor